MKKPIIITISTIFMLAVAVGAYLLNGCQKNVEPIVQTESYLQNVDYSGYNQFITYVSEAIATNSSNAELDELEESVSNLLSEDDSLYITSIDVQEISEEINDTYFLTEQERDLIKSGDIETLKEIIDRFNQPISLLENDRFIDILEQISNDPIISQYLPKNVDFTDFNLGDIYVSCRNAVNLKSAMAVDCDECDINYASCVLLATGRYLLSSASAANDLLDCLAAALILQAIPFVGQALYIAAVVVCTAKFAYDMIQIATRYSQDLASCESQYTSCLSNCHQGGSGN